jgi:hypothetical protein
VIDTVTCEYALPISGGCLAEIIDPPDWQEVDFQTDSFFTPQKGLFIDNYTISEDGQLYKDIVEREVAENKDGFSEIKEKNNGIEKQDYTGEINLYGIHLEEEYDFYVTFRALFWKGDLKELLLDQCDKNSNEKRKESQRKLKEQLKKIQKEEKEQNVVLSFFKNILILFLFLIRWIFGSIVRFVWRIERKIK